MPLTIVDLAACSQDLTDGERFPEEFTADGGNRTPRMQILGVPDGTVELAATTPTPLWLKGSPTV